MATEKLQPESPKETSNDFPEVEQVIPHPPEREGLDPVWAESHQNLYDRVKSALLAIESGFNADIEIAGINATDLFGLNSALGSAIEMHVVDALNKLRPVWDPDGEYPTFTFIRYAQSFPDVRLVNRDAASENEVLMGIELKGWFALAKEQAPSFRFEATPLACARQDLIVVVPWVFNNVISGRPKLLTPYIEEARFAARARNHYWTWVKGSGQPNDQIKLSKHNTPYPRKIDESSDKPVYDGGKNFGRIARTNILNEFIVATIENDAAGIPIKYWIQFLSAFTEGAQETDRKVATLIRRIRSDIADDRLSDDKLEILARTLIDLFSNE
jgi:hypothetical protein